MNDNGPTNPDETVSGRPGSSAASETSDEPARRPSLRRLLANKRRRWIGVAAVLVTAMIGRSVGLANSRSTTAPNPVAAAGGFASGSGSGDGASNARSGPATGGASGTVDSVSTSSFTMTTSAGQKVTVDETSSTTYQDGTNSTITTGDSVLALGMTNGTTITATQVIVTPAGGDGSATASATSVIPFQSGAPITSQQVGQVLAADSQGSGTIVSGTTANNATEAALAAYPGGIVNRVVQLSDGEYEVHNIGVSWPHHVFVDQDFTVVGAM